MDKAKLLLTAVWASIAPIHAALGATLCLIVVDLITGIVAAHRAGEDIESGKIKITVVKLLVYELAIILAWIVGQYLVGPTIPVLSVVTSVIGITELKSCIENLNKITGTNLLTSILSALSARSKDE